MESRFSVRTPDGRWLDVYVAGADGRTALVFHNGTPSTGQLYAPFVQAASERGLRMVGFSRPGYGGSIRNPGRRVSDVVFDVTAVVDQLGAERFYSLGWSGGGPHALACAALLPGRVIGAATIGGLAPYDAMPQDWLTGMGEANADAFRAAVAGDDKLRQIGEKVASMFANATPESLAASMGDLVSEVDRSALTGEAARWLAHVFQESVRNGMWGWYDDERALVQQWGFDVGDITVPVAVWQGSQDPMTPPTHGEWLASHISGAHAHLLADHGHLSLGVASFGTILDDLLTIAPAAASHRGANQESSGAGSGHESSQAEAR